MRYTLLQILSDSTRTVMTDKNSASLKANYWFWIAVIELAIILLLVIKKRKKRRIIFDNSTENTLNISKSSNVDMDDLMNNINKSKDLYKKLSTKCHPDRFIDEELNKKADSIFQEITKNQRNYNQLLAIKELAQKELKITI